MKGTTITIIILAVLLVALGSYFGYTQYSKLAEEKRTGLMQQGAVIGYQQAVVDLYQQALTCNPVPVKIEDKTINMIAVECLQQAQQQQTAQ